MQQEAVHIPDRQTGVDIDNPLQTIASELYSIQGLTVTDGYIAFPLQSPVEGLQKILVFGGGQFSVVHILDTTRECAGRPRTVNSINRPDDTEAVAFAQRLRKLYSETPNDLPDERYLEALGAVRQLLTQDRANTEAAFNPLMRRMQDLGNKLRTINSFLDEVPPEV